MAQGDITVKIGQLEPYPRDKVNADDLVYVGDVLSGKLHNARVDQLPFGEGTGVGGDVNYLGSPFIVRGGDSTVITQGGNTIIEDIRLIGKADYPVHTTQLNVSFRDEDLVYDNEAGKLTIKNFDLRIGERVEIFPSGVNSDGKNKNTLDVLLEKFQIIEKVLSVFMPTPTGGSGALVLWERPASEIPNGWEEATEYKGLSVIGHDPSDSELSRLGGVVGSKTVVLTEDNLPPHSHDVPNQFRQSRSDWRNNDGYDFRVVYSNDIKTSIVGKATPFSVLNPSRIVKYIRFIG